MYYWSFPSYIIYPSLIKQKKNPIYCKNIILMTFLIRVISLFTFIYHGQETTITNWHWFSFHTFNILITFKLDNFSIIFIPIAVLGTWSILKFSIWYIPSDPNIFWFFKCLTTFLLTIIILVSPNNLFQLFNRWEGVGIISFIFIRWGYGQSDANTAALQASYTIVLETLDL